MSSRIHFTLGSTLKELDITRNKLAVESNIRPTTINDMVANHSKSIYFQTLVAIIDTLNRLAKEKSIKRKFDVSDVLIYIEK